MAYRIHDSVVRGEIDNRVKGIVRGKIWLEGRGEPLMLELQGNGLPDLAGCLLTFSNPKKRFADSHLDSLNSVQRGSIGDLTASRKVRVFDIPIDDALEMLDRKEKPPEHMANSLYLEWFSEANGRVVIESSDYEVTISPPEWRLTSAEDEERAQQAAAGMNNFVGKLTEAIEKHKRGQKDPEESWDEHDYEKFLKECDARTDKYGELLDKYGHSDEAHEKIAKEMGWHRELTEEEAERERLNIEEINAACEAALNDPEPEPDPTREGIDWIRAEDGDIRHPVQHRCFEAAMKVWKAAEDLGLSKTNDPDFDQFMSEFQITSAKLAGALNSVADGVHGPEPGFTVAYLKRALDHLHKAQAGLEAVAPKKLMPESMVAGSRKDIFEIRESILRLMDDFRGRRQGD